ncbi:MAG TPA: cupin domain-containing protein, partial [Pyrinomonadaceae bacterium]|nr:cupin domain-containing protein [Pyrinomonadaceae bacterium]
VSQRAAEEEEFDGAATLRMTRPLPRKPDEAADAKPSASAPQGMLTVRAGEGEWVETHDRGVFIKLLFADTEHQTFTTLLRMSPGSRLPRHRHTGTEQCLVLEGDLRAGELRASAGDYICALPGSVHEELSTESGALLLLISPERYEVIA